MIDPELLKELVARATVPMLDVDGNCKYGDTYFSQELFAQLVAKACAELCTDQYRTMDGWGITGADERCSTLIKKTFGITDDY